MKKNVLFDTVQRSNVLIVGVQAPTNKSRNIESYFEEFRNLLASNGIEYDEEVYIKLREIDPGYFFTKGKLHELIDLVKEKGIEEVVISEPLTNQQHRNLGKALGAKIFDRTELILEIFEKGAQSAEGKLQIAIALLQHKKSRVVGGGKDLSQQAGFLGGRGPGETQKEKELRHFEHLISTLRKQLEHLEKIRATQRKQRLTRHIPHIAIIGYTNAGKSTILNALTKSNVLAEDKLFATLDTTTRELYINHTKKGVISDTVGFIQQLPPKLINAFKSTLTELEFADLLLHVVDASDPNWQQHIEVVHEILDDLRIDKPMLYVFNKADLLSPEQRGLMAGYMDKYQPSLLISAESKKGITPLKEFLAQWHH
jgi:GTPase